MNIRVAVLPSALAIGLSGAACTPADDQTARRHAIAALADSLCESGCAVVVFDSIRYEFARLPIGRPEMEQVGVLGPGDLPERDNAGPAFLIGGVPDQGWVADTLGAFLVQVRPDSQTSNRWLFAVVTLPPSSHFRTWFVAVSGSHGSWKVDSVGRYYLP